MKNLITSILFLILVSLSYGCKKECIDEQTLQTYQIELAKEQELYKQYVALRNGLPLGATSAINSITSTINLSSVKLLDIQAKIDKLKKESGCL